MSKKKISRLKTKSTFNSIKKRIKKKLSQNSYRFSEILQYRKNYFSFFSHICTEILERNVDNKYILNNFSNMILDEKKKS